MLGIDLGTTNSLAALFRDGEAQLIPNAHGACLTPSFWLHQFEWRIGRKAVMERDRKYYRRYWRAYLLDFIERSNASAQIVLNLLRFNGQPDSPSCFEFASADAGLALFSSLVGIRASEAG